MLRDDYDWFHKYQIMQGRHALQVQHQERQESAGAHEKDGKHKAPLAVSPVEGLLHLVPDIEEEGRVKLELHKMKVQIRDCIGRKRTLFGQLITNSRDLFDAMETHGDGDGLVGFDEFVSGFERLKFAELTPSLTAAVFNHIDVDSSGAISFEEWDDSLGDGDGSVLAEKRKEKKDKERKKRADDKANAEKVHQREEAGAWHVMAMRRLFDPIEKSELLSCKMLGKLMRKHLNVSEDEAHIGVRVPYADFSAAVQSIDQAVTTREIGAIVTCIGAEPGSDIDLDLFLDVMFAYQTYRSAVERIVQAFAGSDRQLFGQKITGMEDLFHALDRNNNGALSQEEFLVGCERIGLGIGREQLQQLYDSMSPADGHSEGLSCTEFLDALKTHSSHLLKRKPRKPKKPAAAKPIESPKKLQAAQPKSSVPSQRGLRGKVASRRPRGRPATAGTRGRKKPPPLCSYKTSKPNELGVWDAFPSPREEYKHDGVLSFVNKPKSSRRPKTSRPSSQSLAAANQRLASTMLERQLDFMIYKMKSPDEDLIEEGGLATHMQNVIDGFNLLKDNND